MSQINTQKKQNRQKQNKSRWHKRPRTGRVRITVPLQISKISIRNRVMCALWYAINKRLIKTNPKTRIQSITIDVVFCELLIQIAIRFIKAIRLNVMAALLCFIPCR